MSNLDNITRKILEDANGKAEEIKKEAEVKAQEILQKKSQEADVMKAKMLDKAQVEAAQLKERIVANASLRARNELLEAKQSVIDRVLVSAKKSLLNLDDKDYKTFVTKIVSGQRLDPGTVLKVPTGKKQILAFNEYKVEESQELSSGFQIVNNDMTINYDFNELIDYMKDDLEGDIVKIIDKK